MFDGSEKTNMSGTEDSDERFSSLHFNSHDPVFIIDRKGEFIDVNDAFCKKLGLSKKEIIGTRIGEANFLTESGRKEAMYRHVSRLIGKETPIYTLDVMTRDGGCSLLRSRC
jgi:PAS domain S-box-containing protein